MKWEWLLNPSQIAGRVEIDVVSRGRFLQTVDDDGKTRVRDRFIVSAPLNGVLQRVTLEAGDPVKEGATVAIITPSVPALLDVRTETTLTERYRFHLATRAVEYRWRRLQS